MSVEARTLATPLSRVVDWLKTNPGLALALLTATLTVLRLTLISVAGLTNDEAYYRLWSLAPAWSYLDHPPMVAWIIALGRAIAGDSELGVRLFAPLLIGLGAWAQWRASRPLFDRHLTIYATLFLLAMPIINIGAILVTPDLTSVVSFGLLLLCVTELDRSQNPNWWLAVGFFAGCGVLSKYTNLFAGATVAIWLLAVPENRKWLKSPQLWIGGLIAALMFLPVLGWNATHDWASFQKQFGRVTTGHAFSVRYLADFAGCYFGLASPAIAVLSVLGLVHLTKRAWRYRSGEEVLLVAAVWPMLIYFAVHALHSRVMPNWPVPIYPALAMCAAEGLRTVVPDERQLKVALAAAALGFATSAVIYLHALNPLVALNRDPTGEMRGWGAFSEKIRDLQRANGAQWIATSGFQTTGQLSFAFRDRIPVVQLSEQIRFENLPAVSRTVLDEPALYVEPQQWADDALLRKCFEHADRIENVNRVDGTRAGVDYAIYRLSGLMAACVPEGGLRAEVAAH